MQIKICGLFRSQDIDYVNEARPDYAGFVFAQSRRQVSPEQAADLRRRLAEGIVPVGVFVNSPPDEIAALYRSGIIAIAQLHGGEDDAYIARLKDITAAGGMEAVPVIQVFTSGEIESGKQVSPNADYLLFDSGAGSGKTFDWNIIKTLGENNKLQPPFFLAGGICLDNIEQAAALKPFALDVSSGAETGGVKDREKIIQLVAMARKET